MSKKDSLWVKWVHEYRVISVNWSLAFFTGFFGTLTLTNLVLFFLAQSFPTGFLFGKVF